MRWTSLLGGLVWCVVTLACGGPTQSGSGAGSQSSSQSVSQSAAGSGTATTVGTPPALPAEIEAQVHLPGAAPDDHLFVRVSLSDLPWTITGCVTGPAGGCEETLRVELTEADRRELVRLVMDVETIRPCEPEGIFPGDRAYRLVLTGFPRPYEGRLPAALADLAVRNAGPCRADARLAWWIAARFQARP
jgi:hypothetical protein